MQEDSKKTIVLAIAMLALILSVIALIGASNQEIVANVNMDQNDKNSITVSGEAEKMVKPDTASVSFTLTRKSKTLSLATKSVNERMSTLMDSLTTEGIEEKDIKTTSYSVYPEYTWNNGQRNFTGYRVSQRLEIKIRDLDKVEKIMTKISTLKVDNVSGLRFFVDDDKEIREELRNKAITNAKKKADKLASELGVGLGKIISFRENESRNYHQQYRMDYAMVESKGVEVNANIPTGENQIKASVSITYRLK